MDDEQALTPWEDINPPMGLAPQQGQHSASSAPTEPRTVFRNELTACLALVAPVGMTEESRGEWLAVAWDSLKHLPPDILQAGARRARLKCDHPSKIVPTIIAETEESLRLRSRLNGWDNNVRRLAAPAPEYCSPEQAAEILESVGLKSRFRSNRDGSPPPLQSE